MRKLVKSQSGPVQSQGAGQMQNSTRFLQRLTGTGTYMYAVGPVVDQVPLGKAFFALERHSCGGGVRLDPPE